MSLFEYIKLWWNNEQHVLLNFYYYRFKPKSTQRILKDYASMEKQLRSERAKRHSAEKITEYLKKVNAAITKGKE